MLWKAKLQANGSLWNRSSCCSCGTDIGDVIGRRVEVQRLKLKTEEAFSKKLDPPIASDLPVRHSYSAGLNRSDFGVQRAVFLQIPLPLQKAEKTSSAFCTLFPVTGQETE